MNHQDVFSEVFSTLRLQSNLYFRAQFSGEFSIEIPREPRTVRFHLVREGECYLKVPGIQPVLIRKGDLALVPDGASQSLCSTADLKPVSLSKVLDDNGIENGTLKYGKGAEQMSLLCGYCSFDEAVDHPILTELPALMVINPFELESEPSATMALELLSLEAEHEEPGMTGILSRMLEIIFIQSVRRITASQVGSQRGFIAALRDPKLSKALSIIHTKPEESWTINNLAQKAGMSRARFADRFTNIVGIPPISYLTKWRLMKSRSLLSTTNLKMEEIASRCGYASTSAFSRRFKEEFQVGPGAYRKAP